MPGREFGADLYRIWLVGKKHLPTVADSLAETRGKVLRSELGDAAFRRPDVFGGGLGPAHQAIADLREQLSRMLDETSTNMHLTGDALVLAADAYAASDTAARDRLNEMRNGAGGGMY